MRGKIRRHATYIYYDKSERGVAQICGAWNFEDKPLGFDFADFHTRSWDMIMQQERIYGARVIEYDRYGNLYGIREPHDQAEWEELTGSEYWRRELAAEKEEVDH
ncbi:hypothetical protein [uncultured Corynebacterium sp.]|uniref:hypothetical protein n=1 Tax=uncultured Corynebacterium sp. TaxID=159447 RepID=UPI0026377C5F|nr:hypothetical protein [uncultured Corynebacterium sp.]